MSSRLVLHGPEPAFGRSPRALFSVCAVFAHLRVRWYATIPFPAAFLLLAVAALVSRLAST